MSRIVLQGVSKVFRSEARTEVQALRDINLAVESGEFLVLVGPSGCGKTTLLRLIAGLEQPSSGTLLLDGVDAAGLSPSRRELAMVFQHHTLYPHLSVFENLGFGLRLAGVSGEERRNRIREVAALLQVTSVLERMPGELSGGQRQRVALGRAILRRPQAYLLDEPLAHLDSVSRAELRLEWVRIQRQFAATVVYVTHDQTEALGLGDRVAVLNRGELQQIGTPREVYQRPQNVFVAGFLGNPAMNLLRGECRLERGEVVFLPADGQGEDDVLRVGKPLGELPRDLFEREVILGVRPEHIALSSTTGTTAGGSSAVLSVEWVEMAGADVFVHCRWGASAMTVRVREKEVGGVEPSVGVVLEFGHLHFFDARNGVRLF